MKKLISVLGLFIIVADKKARQMSLWLRVNQADKISFLPEEAHYDPYLPGGFFSI